MLKLFKQLLTIIGVRMNPRWIVSLQAFVNYIRLGNWMKSHGFAFVERQPDRNAVFEKMAAKVTARKLLYLEFGVAYGESIRWWSAALKSPDAMLHGFDSFEGLPEEGGPWAKGQFDAKGKPPEVPDKRVTFFKGWFDQVLPTYKLPPHDQLIVNLDADLYSSTIYVLRQLRPHLKPGTLVYFDEMNHMDHAPRAFDEFVADTRIRFKPLAADKTLAFVAFEIEA